MAWTDEQKALAIKQYTDANPTPETSTEIIKEIAEALEQSPNGLRMILSQAGVYVKKGEATPTTTKAGDAKEPAKRVSKESSIQALKDAIKAKGKAVDDDVLDKLTGKAAIYLTGVLG